MFHFPNKISETVGGSRLAQYFMTKVKFGGSWHHKAKKTHCVFQ